MHNLVLAMKQVVPLTATMQSEIDSARRIKVLIEVQTKLGWTSREWCLKAGLSANTLYNFYKGRSRSLHADTLDKLAAVASMSVSELTGEQGPPRKPAPEVPIIGSVEAGVWRESPEWPGGEGGSLVIPVPPEYSGIAFAVAVDGPSMNQVFPQGSYVICVSVWEFQRDLRTGDKVVVRRRSADGHYEFTLKEIVFDNDGRPWLWPRSDHPQYQSPIEIPWPITESDDDSEIAVIAFVLGSYTPMPL